MGEVVPMPGVFRPDLEQPTEPQAILRNLLNHTGAIVDLVYVARMADGNLFIGASHTDMDAAIGLLMRGANSLDSGPSFEAEVPER